MSTVLQTATAWELIGFPDNEGDRDTLVRVKGGRTLYEAVTFYDDTPGENVKLTRLDTSGERLRQVNRYVHPDTALEIVAP